MSKATPIYRNGQRYRINGMAASSIANKLYDVSECGDCGHLVAWAQGKGGGWYTCKVMEYTSEGGYEKVKAAPWVRHDCSEIVYAVYDSSDGLFPLEEFATREEAQAFIQSRIDNLRSAANDLLDNMDMIPEEKHEFFEQLAEDNLISAVNVSNEWKINERRKVK